MTVTKIQSKKKNCCSQSLQLSGSQINLSPRPMPVTHISTWCSSFQSFPIRRAVSAFGFQQKMEEHGNLVNRSRPLSADNIRYVNRQNFADDYRDEIIISSRCRSGEQEFADTGALSGNVYENILNGYSENKRTERIAKSESASNLKPGLSSKPPLPPFADAKACANKSDPTPAPEPEPELEKLVENDENLKTAAEKEAFDEIIALKFQRWFPNTIDVSVGLSLGHGSDQFEASSSDSGGGGGGGGSEIDDVELVSYKERNYKTCEYRRYEILRKNTTKTTGGTCNGDKSVTKQGARKRRPKGKPISPSPSVDDDAASQTSQQKRSASEIDTVASSRLVVSSEREQRDLGRGKLADSDATPIAAHSKFSEPATKASSFKKTNFQSPNVSPLKKHKKISFFVDKAHDERKTGKGLRNGRNDEHVEDKNGNDVADCAKNNDDDNRDTDKVDDEDFVETYFAKKKSRGLSVCVPSAVNEAKFNGRDFPSNTRLTDSRDATISPQQPAGSQIEDVLSWMCTHRGVQADTNCNSGMPAIETNNSMYEEMIDILKDIEKENIRKDDATKTNEEKALRGPSSTAKAMWSLIEEAEKANDIIESADFDNKGTYHQPYTRAFSPSRQSPANTEEKTWNRLSDLLRLPTAELAQKVMSLQLLLDERESILKNLNARFKTIEQTHQQQTQQLEYSIQKQLKLVEQLKIEKKTIAEKMQNTINDLEKKHAAALVTLDEKHKIELKKSLEKQAAADKLERDKWLETKTQKIRDLTIKGLEPELNRMAAAHQEEIAEIRKFHKRQIEEVEEAAGRRMAVQKEKLEAEKEKALAIEREISRQKLADEIGELEKRYQEQRKRLLAEVHVERENMERENEATLAIREKDNERKWEKRSIEMQKKIEALKQQHQEEMKKMQQNFESEKQIWMKNQIIELSDRESKIREQCKKERDKHIELIIQKLENENTERETVGEQKIKRLKEKYEAEIRDLETLNENFKRKLNESRNEMQKNEDFVSQLRAQSNQSQTEYVILKEKYDRLLAEQEDMQTVAKSELTTRIHILQSELSQAQLTYESQIKMLKSENERELSQMYNKVKEMIDKKDYLIRSLNNQKDAALKQCNQLEELLQLKRKDRIVMN